MFMGGVASGAGLGDVIAGVADRAGASVGTFFKSLGPVAYMSGSVGAAFDVGESHAATEGAQRSCPERAPNFPPWTR